MKKNLDFMGMRNFSVVLNGSLMKSRVDFDDESLEHDRPLQGQSPYLVNAGLFYQSPKLGLTVGVLYNRIGKRIVIPKEELRRWISAHTKGGQG